MRIALCLSGLVRTYRSAYHYWQSQLYGPNNNRHHIDIFISTWRHTNSLDSHEADRLTNRGWPQHPIDQVDQVDLQRLYQPTRLTIEDELRPDQHPAYNLLEAKKHPGTNVAALLNMLYKVHACDHERLAYERQHGFRYDCVIRTRFDLKYGQPILVEDHLQRNLEGLLGVITIPSMGEPNAAAIGLPHHRWANDKFAIGPGPAMTLYSSLYHNLSYLVEEHGVPVQPEVLLHHHLNNHRLTVKELGRELEIVR